MVKREVAECLLFPRSLAQVQGTISSVDGLLLTGGPDVDPLLYGQARDPQAGLKLSPRRDRWEMALLKAALERDMPVLAICRGMQLLNVVLGGTLHQDIGTSVENAREHEQPTSPTTPDHPVKIEKGSPLFALIGREEIQVNSTHHQAVDVLGEGLAVWGRSPDGIIEVIGRDLLVIGVQWHPELLDDDVCRALYRNLVERAR